MPAFNKVVKSTSHYTMGDLKLTFDVVFEGVQGAGTTSHGYSFDFNITNNGKSSVELASDTSFFAYYKGKSTILTEPDSNVTINAGGTEMVSITFTDSAVPANSLITDAKNAIFKFHYNNKSIMFRADDSNSEVLTTGVYTEKL